MHSVNAARRALAVGFFVGSLALLSLSGCGVMPSGPRQIHISETQLLSRIAAQFPLKQRQLGLFEVALDQPRLRLLPAENRVATELSYSVGFALMGAAALKGQVELSYGLRFEPSDNTVRLDQARIERLDVDGLSATQAQQVKKIGSWMADELLKDAVLHQLKPEDLQTLAGRGYRPGAIRVVPGGLRLTLDPLSQ